MEEMLDWVHDGRGSRAIAGTFERFAQEAERHAIADALGLETLEELTVRYRIEPQAKGRYLVTGEWRAAFVQTCVATLEPLATTLNEPFEVVFAPTDEGQRQHELVVDAFGEDEPEPIENGLLHVGRVIYEQLASAIDPFPRRPDADFDWKDSPAETTEGHPFAALAALKKKESG